MLYMCMIECIACVFVYKVCLPYTILATLNTCVCVNLCIHARLLNHTYVCLYIHMYIHIDARSWQRVAGVKTILLICMGSS